MSAKPAVRSPGYQMFMLALCLYALATLTVETVANLDAETRAILEHADVVVCGFFLADFLASLFLAEKRLRYLYTWGWIDLVSSIPMLDAARWGRAARVARIFRVVRGLRATTRLASLVLERRAENAFLAVSLVALLLIVAASISILQFESASSNIRTAEDALWWAVTTITTVGYGLSTPPPLFSLSQFR